MATTSSTTTGSQPVTGEENSAKTGASDMQTTLCAPAGFATGVEAAILLAA
jgi:hypothetical protein